MSGIYVASKAKHAEIWQKARQRLPICSTWIDEAQPGESYLPDLWERCVREAAQADALVLFVQSLNELHKGSLVEVGAALAHGVPVLVVAPSAFAHSWLSHRLVRRFNDLESALHHANELVIAERRAREALLVVP